MKVGMVAQLIVKRGADPKTWKGIKFFTLDKSGRPEYYEEPLILWKNDSDALLAGYAREVPLYVGTASEKQVKK